MLQDGKYLEKLGRAGGRVADQGFDFFADLGGMFEGSEESEYFPGSAHLGVDVMSGSLGGLILGVESGVLHESEDLSGWMCTLSLLDVLESRSRKVARYDIK